MMEPILEFVQNNLMYVMLALTSGAMLIWQTARAGVGGGGVSPLEATLLLNREDAQIIDVREDQEWAGGHIANARHISLGQLDKRIHELEKFKSRPLIVCCQSGNRSGSVCSRLKKKGFENVHNLAGGIGAWKEAGLPVTTGK